MANHVVTLETNEGIFRGLSKQNMLFHQCIGELVDNSIASALDDKKVKVSIILKLRDDAFIDLYICDNGRGMSLKILMAALQLGKSATDHNRLNEHGFGLKNALATLSGGNGSWSIYSKEYGQDSVCNVSGPFKQNMDIEDSAKFPHDDSLPSDISTLIHVPVKLSYVQTVQGRGAPTKDLSRLRMWLIEHLGVMYRGYLEADTDTDEPIAIIEVSIKNDTQRVQPVQVPIGKSEVKYLEVELAGELVKIEYRYGTLDEEKRNQIIRGSRAQYYYQGNIPSQGIDIRLGKRTIATRQFETIWKTLSGDNQLNRHNNFNDFVGELKIPVLPRGILSTVNNKTDFNLEDIGWTHIFDALNAIRPPERIREESEKAIRNKWISMLKATNPDDLVTDETAVWPDGTYIDVYRESPIGGKIIIYELKVGTGAPLNLYQLKMYWDGLVLDKKLNPSEAFLICEEYSANLENMANLMNQMPTPDGSNNYNFKLAKRRDLGL